MDIGSNKLSDTNVHHFEQFCWSALEEIDVSRAGLAGQSLCRLCSHVRPYVRKARFKGSTLLGPCLADEWSNLEVLDVRHAIVLHTCDDSRYRYKWAKIRRLDFTGSLISLATLVNAERPLLETLDLSKVYMGALDILVQGAWSKLKHLRLGYGLLPPSVSTLVLGNWPLLVTLHIQLTCHAQSQLDDARKMILWPRLKELAFY